MDTFYNIIKSNVDLDKEVPENIRYLFYTYCAGIFMFFLSTFLGAIFYLFTMGYHLYSVGKGDFGLAAPFLVPFIDVAQAIKNKKQK